MHNLLVSSGIHFKFGTRDTRCSIESLLMEIFAIYVCDTHVKNYFESPIIRLRLFWIDLLGEEGCIIEFDPPCGAIASELPQGWKAARVGAL
jgi:hypothetical protein